MKSTVLAIIVAVVLIGGAIVFSSGGASSQASNTPASVDNVSIVDGKQIIDIQAKGGYSPKRTTAKAGMPTVLRFNTNGTFDCSSSVRIPSMGFNKILPASGATEVDLGTPNVATLQGTCGMGMYSFQIDFQG